MRLVCALTIHPIVRWSIAFCFVFVCAPPSIRASDWPQWRYEAARGGVTPHELSTNLRLHWERQLPRPAPAWPSNQAKLQFDVASHAVCAVGLVIVNSSLHDNVVALDSRTGQERWRFYAEAPIRLAPIAAKSRVYFASDDGWLYCVSLETGKLFWKFNGAPSSRKVLGNQRLISSWPARGGPVLDNDRIYFACSIWPFMGVFIHAVDAETGESIWTNSGDGTNFTVQPHGAPAFATIGPQGHLVVSDDYLIVPGGRSVPAVYDKHTGQLKHFEYDNKRGGHHVFAADDYYFVGNTTYDLSGGTQLKGAPVLAGPSLIYAAKRSIAGKSRVGHRQTQTTVDKHGQKRSKSTVRRETRFAKHIGIPVGTVHLQTGSVLWAVHDRRIQAFDLNATAPLQPMWQQSIDADVWQMIAANDRLFVITRGNRLLCFGPGRKPAVPQEQRTRLVETTGSDTSALVRHVLQNTEDLTGYAVVLGIGTGQLIDQLLGRTDLHLIVLDKEASRVDASRRQMEQSGHYGRRVSVHTDLTATDLPPYLANLIIAESDTLVSQFVTPGNLSDWYQVLRPYGGKACVPLNQVQQRQWSEQLRRLGLHGAQFTRSGPIQALTRLGPLAGSDDWSHQYGNAAQSGVSLDFRVKAPLGVLWFGGPSHEGILPRHGHGPAPQVAGGRIVIEGPDLLRCLDVYTGRLLWERKIKSIGSYYNVTRHFSGASEIGGNYVTLPDSIYVVYGSTILKLDAATGRTTREFRLQRGSNKRHWGHLSVWQDLLVATSSPVSISTTNLNQTRDFKPTVLSGETAIIQPKAVWKYLAGRDPNTRWSEPDFDDSRWKAGRAGFGYGDDDDQTVLSDMAGNYNRVYLRHSVSGRSLRKVKQLALLIRFDDAFIAYLNGTEVARASIKEGRGVDAKVESHEAGKFQIYTLENWKHLVRPGKNLLAIEGHNIGLKSSDFTIDPYLVGRSEEPNQNGPDKASLADFLQPTRFASGSRRLVVMNRHTGQRLWEREARFNFRHNNIAVGSGKVFCIDRLSDSKQRSLQRRGVQLEQPAHLHALDAYTGRVVWETDEKVFGTFLNYSEQHDTLIQGGSVYRDRAADESRQGLVAYRGRDGYVRWRNDELVYGGPCLLWKDQILTNGKGGVAIDLTSGKKSGWSYDREYGCNTAVGCQSLLTFRSGAAGFYDLQRRSGTGNLGGFRSSCTNNLIPANGVLAVPDYTRTCDCAYQNQTSLALVHMPTAEFWTFGGQLSEGQFGLNFGAPGDRRSANGTLWLDIPSVGGRSPEPHIEIQPSDVRVFRFHSSQVSGGMRWVAASGVEGIRKIELRVESDDDHRLRMFFLEPHKGSDWESREFHVKIQGEIVLNGFSPGVAAGAAYKAVSRTFHVTPNNKTIVIQFVPLSGRQPVISGLEVIREET